MSRKLLLISSLIRRDFFVKHIKFEKRKELKKELSEELMLVAWHSNRWWDWCISEEKKKEIDPMFIEEL